MIHRLTFQNYKPFKEQQELDLKPLTILIGKNSSGKSAVAKLPVLIEGSLKGEYQQPILLFDKRIDHGAEFKDLIFERNRLGRLELGMINDNESLDVIIGAGTGTKDLPQILEWKLSKSINHKGTITKKDFNSSFKGFQLKSNDPKEQIESLVFSVDYFGPFRIQPDRDLRLENLSPITQVGFPKNNAYQLLIQDSLTTEQTLIQKVSDWYKRNFEGWGVRVNGDIAPIYHVELTRNIGPTNINIVDAGQGMSQALPLVVRALMPTEKDTLIVMEQPELHLHPAAHGDLAELFVNSLTEGSKRYLIETHSQNFVLRLRRLIAQGTLKPNDLALYFVDFDEESGTSNLKPIKVDELGEVDFWPEKIFNESLDEVLAIRRAQKNKQK
jgi:predicted ATPase